MELRRILLYAILIATTIVSVVSIHEVFQGGVGKNGSSVAVCFTTRIERQILCVLMECSLQYNYINRLFHINNDINIQHYHVGVESTRLFSDLCNSHSRLECPFNDCVISATFTN